MQKTPSIGIGLCGLGTVGSGLVNIFKHQANQLDNCQLVAIGARRTNPLCDTNAFVLQDIFAVAKDPHVDILVELIGGTDTARELIITAMQNGKHIVTANKALIAECGTELFAIAHRNNVALRYEAAVAAGTPIVSVLQNHLRANHILSCVGIINGTSNFILTKMREEHLSFDNALALAQEKGYAEADPTFDIGGTDIAHKLAILLREAFAADVAWQSIERQPLKRVQAEDVQAASELGYTIKMIGRAVRTEEDAIEASVYPMLIKKGHMLSDIEGTMNGILVTSEPLGKSFYYGAGAGAGPTASSVAADIVAVSSYLNANAVMPKAPSVRSTPLVAFAKQQFAFYWRLLVPNCTGVLASIATCAAQQSINIEALLQKESTDETTEVIILTFPVSTAALEAVQIRLQEHYPSIQSNYLPILATEYE